VQTVKDGWCEKQIWARRPSPRAVQTKTQKSKKKTVATEKGSSDGLHTFTYDLQTFTYGIHLLHFKKIPDFSNQAQIKRNETQTHLFLPPDHESKLGFHI
jgi:hypothetical protein